ncbi:hypothetical protein [Maricaulis sp.]|uniref:hypothetical protein n=1 Tax=Maricaulis sp. TaxID=1486257 RepID=UPI0026183DB3|nr:hypothetical protein [Maricaulis sp.]
MTELYEYPLLVAPLSIRCPACGLEARFETGHSHALPVRRAGKRHFEAGAPDWSGEVRCLSCTKMGRHELSWPEDSYYAIEHGGQTLWALDREMMVLIRRFVAAGADRSRVQGENRRILSRIPALFLDAKSRDEVVRKIDKVLGLDRAVARR